MILSKRKKEHFYRQAVCSLLCVIMLIFTAIPCMAAELARKATLKVAFYPLDGFFEYDAAGNEVGYGVEPLEKLEDYANVDFEYVKADSWEATKSMLLSGEADIRMPGTLPSTPSATLGYTTQGIIDTFHVIMTGRDNQDFYYMDTERFPAMKLAMTEYAYTKSDVPDYVYALGIKEENLIRYDDYDACLAAVMDGTADAVVSNIMDLTDDLKILARFNSTPNYISTRIDDPWLAVLDEALYELKMDDPTFRPELYAKWYPERTAVPFTREEAEYIKNSETITVGMLRDRYTFSVYNPETGEITGVNRDIVDWISAFTGLDFKLEPLAA